MMSRLFLILMCLVLPLPAASAQVGPTRPMQISDLFAFKRVSDPQISPDGASIAYVVAEVSLAKNASSSDIWLAPTTGGKPKRLTTSPKNERHPRWHPDGTKILFESNRSGQNQLWLLDLEGGGEARQLTHIATGASDAIWSPDGRWIAFVSAVYPEYAKMPFAKSDAANKKRMDEAEASPVKARVFTRLFFRHWDSYVEDRRQHLFVIPAAGGEPRDVTPIDRDAFPTSFTFASGEDFTFTPDSKHLIFTAPPAKDEAWSTNYDLCKVAITGKIETMTTDNPAADNGPQFSPDGKWLAYRAQKKPGFEADRWQIYLVDAEFKGKPKSITADFDGSPEAFVWSPDGRSIYFIAQEKGRSPIFSVNVETGKITKHIDKHSHAALTISKTGKLALLRHAMTFPGEVCVNDLEGTDTNISQANENLLAKLNLPAPESVTIPGAGGTPMQMWILKPPGFDPAKKWPLVYLVHGGPQGAWSDGWSFRWNPEIWAAQGYVVALPNPRGSSGFGQKYLEEISGDWGGKCFDDLMKGVNYLEQQPYIDSKRMGAAGASFGGYMMNWFQGHTDRFQTLITHSGVYNFDSMYATTEELWFDEWEHDGPPWEKGNSYKKYSPHLYAKNFKTPMLIIHGDLDFRVPVSEGLQLFTTLQRLRVPSRMINFPDESHWVLRPRNSEFWHREVFAWLTKYVPPGGK
jgi:dipeptidyl aminopeptidase/acylaminoacyl peptidase